MWRRIEPARVALDATGAPYSEAFGDVYASRAGALPQARHVFLGGNDLPARWRDRSQFVIVETGFGLGTNFLATWHAWRADPQRPRRLHFVSIEMHPVDVQTLLRFAPLELAPLARSLAADWPMPVAGLHRRTFENGAVTLTLAVGDATILLAQLVAGADAFYLDGFAPDRNPDMWAPRLLKALARLARDDATAATWSTAHVVREGLEAAGFVIEIAPGFATKRQMLRARFAPRWRVRRHAPPRPFDGERDVLVIGAGLAGAHAAHALAARGWRVQVIERAERVAAGASALPVGLLHPHVALDDNDAARLTRAGFFLATRLLSQLCLPSGEGTYVQASDDAFAERWRDLARTLVLPEMFAHFSEPASAADMLGILPRASGWWFPGATRVAVPHLCTALLRHASISIRFAAAVERIERRDGNWCAVDPSGAPIAAAPYCIVATALDAPRLLRLHHAPIRPVRGRLSLVNAPALVPLRAAISGAGTLARISADTFAVGATYEVGEIAQPASAAETTDVHRGNLQRLARLLHAPIDAAPIGLFDATRCVARDRLPLVGAVADESIRDVSRGAHLADLPRVGGLYASFAFGSRGLALAPLAAELIAAKIEGEPWPVERDLAARIDSARFLLQSLRR